MENLVIISNEIKNETLVLLSAAISAMNDNNQEHCVSCLNDIKKILGLEDDSSKTQNQFHEFLVKFNPVTYEQKISAISRPGGTDLQGDFRFDYHMIENANRFQLEEDLKSEAIKKLEVGNLYYCRNGGVVQYFIIERIEKKAVFVSRCSKDGLKSSEDASTQFYSYESLVKAKNQPELAH